MKNTNLKYMKILKKYIKGNHKLNINLKKSELACMICCPPVPLKDHLSLGGVLVHKRIDCPEEIIYFTS